MAQQSQATTTQPIRFYESKNYKKKFSELVDLQNLQSLLDDFNQIVGIADAIIDTDAVILLGSGWQQICTDFHRQHPKTCQKCIESDTSLLNSMLRGEKYAIYGCPNGLVDAAAPIIIEGEHVANFFLGQYFLEPPDIDFFRQQGKELGFNEADYLEAVAKVPVISKDRVKLIMNFLIRLAEVLGEMGLQQIKLHEALAALNAHDKLKDEFLANTSHELRTPLNGIIGIAESLIDGATGQLSETTRSNLSMIVSSGKRLSVLVNDILDFSKLRHKDLVLQFKPVSLREIVDIVLTLSQPLIANNPQLQLHNTTPSDLPPVLADENRLQQIFHNLVGNAIKFTTQGSVTVSAQLLAHQLEIVIADTGIGIPEDKLERIFESFEQAEGSTAREYGGTGLGLAITKQLIELHHGKIRVTSTVGQGTQFIFTLPIADGVQTTPLETTETSAVQKIHIPVEAEESQLITESAPPPYEAQVTSNTEQPSILIVDDEPVNLQVLKNYLSLQNYQIVQTTSGPETLALLETGFKPDAILLDVMMPKMTGYEVTRKLREKWQADELPILLLTAKNQITDLVTGLEAGASDYLTKPISKEELLARLKTHLNIKELQAEAIRLASIEAANKMIMESLRYAKSIQSSLLPDLKQMQARLPQSFVIWIPKDIVGGDFFCVEFFEDSFIIAVVDCTGHGVPGAFMTMVTSTHLRRIIKDEGCREPHIILQRLNYLVKTSLQQDTQHAESDDGLDIALCFVELAKKQLTFSGAKLPLYYTHRDQLHVIKGDRQSLGYKKSDLNFVFTAHILEIEEGMRFYLSTDGFLDQVGGPKYFPLGNKKFKTLLLEKSAYPFDEQAAMLLQFFNDYKGGNDRRDDITVVGFTPYYV